MKFEEPTIRYDPETDHFILALPYSIQIQEGTLRPQVGFKFRASIPEWLWSIVDPEELSHRAALAHDWLYAHGGCVPELSEVHIRRFRADMIFLEIMKEADVFWVTRLLAFLAVRFWGKPHWKSGL